MSPTAQWVLGIIATFAGIGITLLVTVLVSVINRKNDTIEKLREANLNYRFGLYQLGGTAEAANKLAQKLQIPQENDGTGP